MPCTVASTLFPPLSANLLFLTDRGELDGVEGLTVTHPTCHQPFPPCGGVVDQFQMGCIIFSNRASFRPLLRRTLPLEKLGPSPLRPGSGITVDRKKVQEEGWSRLEKLLFVFTVTPQGNQKGRDMEWSLSKLQRPWRCSCCVPASINLMLIDRGDGIQTP